MIAAVNFYVRFGNKAVYQVVGIPMGTTCAPLIADLFLCCYESQFMTKLSIDPSKLQLIDKFKKVTVILMVFFWLNNQKFSQYTAEIYPEELNLDKSNLNSYNCSFLDLDISVLNGELYTKIYDKGDDFSFPIVNFSFLAHLARKVK